MPRSTSSYYQSLLYDAEDDATPVAQAGDITPTSPQITRRPRSARPSDLDLRSHTGSKFSLNERSSLLEHTDGPGGRYISVPETPRTWLSRRHSNAGSVRIPRHHNRS